VFVNKNLLGWFCLGFVGVGVWLTLSPLYVFRGRLAKGRTKQGRNREKTEGTKGQSKGTRGAKGGSTLHRWQKLKKLQKIFKIIEGVAKKNRFSIGGVATVITHITLNPYVSEQIKIFLLSLFKTRNMSMKNATYFNNGLYIKDGRLINMQMDPGMTGISQASLYRKQMKKQYKIDCIADGIERAKMRMDGDKDIFEY